MQRDRKQYLWSCSRFEGECAAPLTIYDKLARRSTSESNRAVSHMLQLNQQTTHARGILVYGRFFGSCFEIHQLANRLPRVGNHCRIALLHVGRLCRPAHGEQRGKVKHAQDDIRTKQAQDALSSKWLKENGSLALKWRFSKGESPCNATKEGYTKARSNGTRARARCYELNNDKVATSCVVKMGRGSAALCGTHADTVTGRAQFKAQQAVNPR